MRATQFECHRGREAQQNLLLFGAQAIRQAALESVRETVGNGTMPARRDVQERLGADSIDVDDGHERFCREVVRAE